MTTTAPAFKFQDNHPPESDFEAEALAGLKSPRKYISPKFFYDEAGSRLFDRICRTEAYYPTRTESAIIRENVDAIAQCIGRGCLLVEPGSGNSAKVRELLHAIRPHSYLPMDISKAFLQKEARKLSEEFPWLEVHAVCSDFTVSVDLPFYPEGVHRVAFFPGSSIGNFDPAAAKDFLKRIRAMVGSDGGLLIGVDRKKDTAVLDRAYNDEEGITEAFNKNLLVRMNRELDAGFQLDYFAHDAFYNEEYGRIEMHLKSLRDQKIQVAKESIEFQAQETIHTENSYKYTPDEFSALAGDAGFAVEQSWSDPREWFTLYYFRAA